MKTLKMRVMINSRKTLELQRLMATRAVKGEEAKVKDKIKEATLECIKGKYEKALHHIMMRECIIIN